MKKAVITGLLCCEDVIQASTMYTRPRKQSSNIIESQSSNRTTTVKEAEAPDHYRPQQVNCVPAPHPTSHKSNVTKISNSTSCHYTAQPHASNLVQLKFKMESISFFLLKRKTWYHFETSHAERKSSFFKNDFIHMYFTTQCY